MVLKQKIISSFLAVLFLALGINYFVSSDVEETDDAFIEGNTIPISSRVSGYVEKLNVKDNQFIKKNDVIAVIDSKDYQLKLDKAKAHLEAAIAREINAAANAKRLAIIGNKTNSQKDIDEANSEKQQATASTKEAMSELDLAQKNFNDTKIIAPADGTITMRKLEQGQYAEIGRQMLLLVGEDKWVVANFKEVQITKMRPGQKAKIYVDAYPDLRLEGHLDSIQMGTGSRFSVFPAENATGNFIKIVQRVPVKITIDTPIDEKIFLGPGLSVEVKLYTK